jgi:two-component system chemotaxis sensor kinase CheA
MIDIAHWLTQARTDWFRPARGRAVGTRRLLLIDDSAFFRSMVVPALSAAGYEVVAVNDAAAALELQAEGESFDLVVSDIEMPGMDGLDFVRRLRAGGPWAELPVIALSARAAPEDIEAGRRAGFTDYVAKFDRGALLRSVEECLSALAG